MTLSELIKKLQEIQQELNFDPKVFRTDYETENWVTEIKTIKLSPSNPPGVEIVID